jgi:DNA-binding CsgD family transcriptional regulator
VQNARAARLAREAVDVAGMGVVVLDGQGRVAWRSPQATRWLGDAFGTHDDDGRTWLQRALAGGEAQIRLADGRTLTARHLGAGGLSEAMLLLRMGATQTAAAPRQPDVPLTPRETEVLSWLAKGKTNRDIAEILGMSPRTVNKHLEHIFEKLGVETRSAATAVAGRLLGQD